MAMATTQLTFTCLKSTVETLEKGVEYDVFLVFHCKLWTHFTPFSSVFIVDLKQVYFRLEGYTVE